MVKALLASIIESAHLISVTGCPATAGRTLTGLSQMTPLSKSSWENLSSPSERRMAAAASGGRAAAASGGEGGGTFSFGGISLTLRNMLSPQKATHALYSV